MTTRCVITGCALIDPNQARWCWGDLHKVSPEGAPRDMPTWVFNAVMSHADHDEQDEKAGETKWHYGTVPKPEVKALILGPTMGLWDKRGIIVIPFADAVLNQPAKEYLK